MMHQRQWKQILGIILGCLEDLSVSRRLTCETGVLDGVLKAHIDYFLKIIKVFFGNLLPK